MKKIYFFASALLLTTVANAQSQRMVLMEEFTQASCGPCASANPAFNALLANNTSKVVSIKYQTSWPGVDPMNAQNPSQVAGRVSYYTVQGVPDVVMDGAHVTGASYDGYPGNVTQSVINAEYAIPSSFSIALSHAINASQDSIFITATITATQDFTAVSFLRAHIVMVEQTISFTNPPGSNGETDFYGVCRKMYPNTTGTSMASTWVTGATQTITVAAAMPSYIYDINEVAIVCFIQDNGNKVVDQAAISTVPVGINSISATESGMSVYPNPSNLSANIYFATTENADVIVNIYNSLGEVVSSENKGFCAEGEYTIAISTENLASGLYTCEMVIGDNRRKSLLSVAH